MRETERTRRGPFGELPRADDARGILAGEYEFDGGEPLRAAEGGAFFLTPAPIGGGAHRGRGPSESATRLSLTDDVREG